VTSSIYEIQADFCRAMGNAARLQIIHTLRDRPLNVSEIAKVTGFRQTLVSRQLGMLRIAGVVQARRHGTETIYQITNEQISKVCDLVREIMVNRIQRQSEAISITKD